MHDDAFDDLRILSNEGLAASPAMTLCALARNEMYFLPAFLDHYRALGIGRFVILDDQSDDGTREFLASQADVLLLGSDRRYGDTFTAGTGPLAGKPRRMVHVWKTLIMQKFCEGRWAVCVDADEFIRLPGGIDFAALVARIGPGGAPAVAGVMLDVYPARVEDLKTPAPFDAATGWYFDAERHVAFAPKLGEFRASYAGVRARLLQRHGIALPEAASASWRRRLVRMLPGGWRFLRFNELPKVVLMKWQRGELFLSSHRTTQAIRPDVLLPILHFKFTPDLYRRTRSALAEGQYFNGSAEYQLMSRLLDEMEQGDGSFLYSRSQPAENFTALSRSRNALMP